MLKNHPQFIRGQHKNVANQFNVKFGIAGFGLRHWAVAIDPQ
jgi:hypothetical protein